MITALLYEYRKIEWFSFSLELGVCCFRIRSNGNDIKIIPCYEITTYSSKMTLALNPNHKTRILGFQDSMMSSRLHNF